MKEDIIIHVNRLLVGRVRRKASKKLVSVSRYVNDLIRDDLVGKETVEKVNKPERKESKPAGVCRKCKGTRIVAVHEGCTDQDHSSRWRTIGRIGACDLCHDCKDEACQACEGTGMTREDICADCEGVGVKYKQ